MRTLMVFMAVVGAVLFVAAGMPPVAAGTAPGIEWDHLFGGVSSEYAYDVQQTGDAGYVFVGSTGSEDGDGNVVGTNHGGTDIWVVRTDPGGIIQGQRLLGGSGSDWGYSVDTTTDGGYIVLGGSDSESITEGGVTVTNNGPLNSNDLWVAKLGPAGGTQNHLFLGGTGSEFTGQGGCIQQTADGGYILVGKSSSTAPDGFFSTNHGGYDILVVKLNVTGALDWAQLLGGNGDDAAYAVQQTADEGFVLAGSTTSSQSGDVLGVNHGGKDIWVVKLDRAGTIVGRRLLGGNQDDIGYSVRETRDGSYIVLGESGSSEYGDVTDENHGGGDYWVVKLGAAGTIEWERLLGGSGGDTGQSVAQTSDGGYILLGSSDSTDGDVTGPNRGLSDFWAVKLDGSGAIQWDRMLGGTGKEEGHSVRQTGDGGYILAGSSYSSRTGDVSDINHGGGAPTTDAWMVKLYADAPGVRAVPPGTALPNDLDSDGRYEDVNGNGRADFADVVLYFNQMTWIASNEPLEAFDYNANGRIDFADVVWLFNHL